MRSLWKPMLSCPANRRVLFRYSALVWVGWRERRGGWYYYVGVPSGPTPSCERPHVDEMTCDVVPTAWMEIPKPRFGDSQGRGKRE